MSGLAVAEPDMGAFRTRYERHPYPLRTPRRLARDPARLHHKPMHYERS